MNKLPGAVLTTQPALLHTRSFIILPLSALDSTSYTSPPIPTAAELAVTEARDARRRHEVAVKRFAFTTKEIDPRVAETYVGLAQQEIDNDPAGGVRESEGGVGKKGPDVESDAVNQWAEDESWELSKRLETKKSWFGGSSTSKGGGTKVKIGASVWESKAGR